MAKQKKLTRKDKQAMTNNMTCWKCHGFLKKDQRILKCTKCDFEVTK